MTLHFPQSSLEDALPLVLSIAKQIDAEGLSASERANVAVTYLVENAAPPWPLALQRQILANATAALKAEFEEDAAPLTDKPAPFSSTSSAQSAPVATAPAPVPAREPAPAGTFIQAIANADHQRNSRHR